MLFKVDDVVYRLEYEYDPESGYCSLEEIYMPGSNFNCIEWLSEDGIKWFENLIVEAAQREL